MFHGLPWLPQVTQSDRDALKHFDANGTDLALERLKALSERRWNAFEFGLIGRKLRKIVATLGPDWKNRVEKSGFVPASLLCISSRTAAHLAEPIAAMALIRGIVLDCEIAEYQEPESWLTQNGARLSAYPPDFALLSLDRTALRLQSTLGDTAQAGMTVSAAIERIATLCTRLNEVGTKFVLVENLPREVTDPQDSVDSWLPGSANFLASHFNHQLVESRSTGLFTLFDVAGISDLIGQNVWQPGRYRYMAGMPFSPDCGPFYAMRLTNLVAALLGKSRRALVLDLDNTLWSGVIGDDGLEGIVLGGDNLLGKIHTDIQRMASQYAKRGIVLCVASKNTREVALEPFRKHPEMVLRESDIAIFEIHWQSKVESIRAMSATLNLGLDAFVFLDDNPAERKQVRDALPSVAVPELPSDPAAWLPVFQAAAYFDQPNFSSEDLKRNEFYRGNAQRATLLNTSSKESEFLRSLEMRMHVLPFEALGRKRIAQLVSKSNQFNLTTQRYSEAQIAEMEKRPELMTLQIRLSDIFGDNGMISVIVCRKSSEIWAIDTWLMSCRVLGRQVEQSALNILARRASEAGARELRGRYIPTSKNGIVKDHYRHLGFKLVSDSDGKTEWSLQLSDFNPVEVPMDVIEGHALAAEAGPDHSA